METRGRPPVHLEHLKERAGNLFSVLLLSGSFSQDWSFSPTTRTLVLKTGESATVIRNIIAQTAVSGAAAAVLSLATAEGGRLSMVAARYIEERYPNPLRAIFVGSGSPWLSALTGPRHSPEEIFASRTRSDGSGLIQPRVGGFAVSSPASGGLQSKSVKSTLRRCVHATTVGDHRRGAFRAITVIGLWPKRRRKGGSAPTGAALLEPRRPQ